MELECGGGTILIISLSIFFRIDQYRAQGANLIFFIPTAISAIWTSSKEKLIDFKIGIPIALFGIIGALIGANITTKMDVNVLRKCFGFFLILITINEIYLLIKEHKKEYKKKKRKHNKRKKDS